MAQEPETKSSKARTVLTGIKPTGIPHIGNWFGAIRPAIELATNLDARYFIADYHALNTIKDPKELHNLTRQVAAIWLACGLDPNKVIFYRQSDVPETFELTTILMAFTSKGLMNRAHAYKAKVAENQNNNEDPDAGINMGLYTYPVLMAADILLFDTDLVPVGKDQVQHIEMAQDIAQALNYNYQKELLVIPQAFVGENNMNIVGLDGRKMSKSYGNTIPLCCPEKELKKLIMKIVSDSSSVEDPKDPDSSHIYTLYKLFASSEQSQDFANRLKAGGMGWGHAKGELFELMNETLKPIRLEHERILQDPHYLDACLAQGAQKARALASKTLKRLRSGLGLD